MKKDRKNSESNIIVGLDIGTTKIAVVAGYKNSEGKINILGYGKGESTGVQHGLIFNIDKTVTGINSAMQMAENRADIEIADVYAGIAGRHVRSKEYIHSFLRINKREIPIEKEEIEKAMDDLSNISVEPGEKIITVIPQRFIIDGKRHTTEPIGEMGEKIQGYYQIITSNETEIKKIVLCTNKSGHQVKAITLEPIASSLSCLTQQEKENGVALVDIGGGTSDIAIYYAGNLVYTKVIPIGGNVITGDIAKICGITREMAEKLKVTYGACIAGKCTKNMITIPQFLGQDPITISEENLANIIYSRVNRDIVEKVKQAIDESGYKDELFGGIVLTGGGALLKYIKELCNFVIQKPVRLAVPEIDFVNLPAELKNPIFSTGLGLLKYGVEMEENPDDAPKSQNKYEQGAPPPIPKKTFSNLMPVIKDFFKTILEQTS